MSSLPTETDQLDVLMPQMGTSVAEGTIVAWRVSVGEHVTADAPLLDVTTDKVDVECPSPGTGVVSEILVAEGETVDVGTTIARLTVDSGSAVPQTTEAPRRERLRRSSPVAARIAVEHGIDLLAIPGTGRDGRITKRDVLRAVESEATPRPTSRPGDDTPMHTESPYRPETALLPVVAAEDDDAPAAVVPDDLGGTPVPLSRMRTTIGQAMRRSLDTAAHCTTVVECDMRRIEQERREQGLTALPLLAHRTIQVLRRFPALNATHDGETITRYDRVHLGIAVSLGEEGLIVPVIHDAQDLSVDGLARRIKDAAVRARAGTLRPDEVRGGTFTITNPGAAGALIATPVINLPQVAILDLEAIVRRPVVVTDADGEESIAIRPMVHLCLGWDHRALDGLYAAQFLTALRRQVEGAA